MIKKILVLGVTGMLGSAVFKRLSGSDQLQVFGTARSGSSRKFFPQELASNLIVNVDVLDNDTLTSVFVTLQPDVVINCVGLIKQLSDSKDPLSALPINSMFPHRLAKLCSLSKSRLIHIGTDCVFSGRKGMYIETDVSDAEDLYGKSKYIGELPDLAHAITLRTSIIGHELASNIALIDWFLSQQSNVQGFTNAIFSGLPTVELADVIMNCVIPNEYLSGLYHVSVEPIDKYNLLKLTSEIYTKKIEIIPNEQMCIDRSLNSTRFREATGYFPPSWPELILKMKNFHDSSFCRAIHV